LPDVTFLNEFGDHNYVVESYQITGEFPDEPRVEDGQMVLFFGGTPLYNFLSSFFENAPPLWGNSALPFFTSWVVWSLFHCSKSNARWSIGWWAYFIFSYWV